MRYIVFSVLLMISLACYAAIYMQVDSNGNTLYSDTPTGHSSQIVDMSQSNITTSPTKTAPTETTPAAPTDTTTTRVPYTTFIITSPADNDTIQNQPTFPVEVKLEPALQPGDKIQLFVDNQPSGDAVASVHLQLSLIARGTHSLYAAIFDQNHSLVKQSPTHTIFVHQASSLYTPPGATKASSPP